MNNKGWARPVSSRKFHYFIGGRSLCESWVFFGPVSNDGTACKDDCKTCTKKLAKRTADEREGKG